MYWKFVHPLGSWVVRKINRLNIMENLEVHPIRLMLHREPLYLGFADEEQRLQACESLTYLTKLTW